MIIEAIRIASINNKRNCRYIQGILNSWINKGYKIVTDIQNEQEQYKEEKKNVWFNTSWFCHGICDKLLNFECVGGEDE